jgi:protein-tyrosine phosphatase
MLGRIAASLRRRWRASRALATARRDSESRLGKRPLKRILVICYGNIYRSAFVGVWLRDRLGDRAEIRSAGFHKVIGRSSPERHVEMSRALGVDLTQHRSALVTVEDLQWADTILLMDRHNWDALVSLGADHDKLIWLGALGPAELEIPDPYRLDDAEAQRVLRVMDESARALLARIEARKP